MVGGDSWNVVRNDLEETLHSNVYFFDPEVPNSLNESQIKGKDSRLGPLPVVRLDQGSPFQPFE